MSKLRPETKVAKFRLGQYQFNAAYLMSPCHYAWSEDDWVRFIDKHGRWV
jgi:hypothetical protein